MSNNPEFEEGPFFFIIETAIGRPGNEFIVWARDAHTAGQVLGMKTGNSIAYIYPELIGGLSDVKRDYRLSPTQIAGLHREGYLRL